VTSSQDGVSDCGRIATTISDVKPGRIYVNPRVAKVFPTVRKEEVTANGKEDIKERVKVAKKQVFPWLCKFNALCREAAGSRSYQRLDDLMNIYIRNVEKDVRNCYKKPNRASKLKTRMNDYLKFFHMLYKEIRKPLEYNHYLDRMSDLLAMYIDMEIKASRRGKENPRTISDRLMSALFILLDNSMHHILNAIIKTKFFVKMFHEICIPIIQRVLRDIPEELTDEQYIQYVLVFKKWKVLLGRKEERQEINRLASACLTPPIGFTEMYHESDKYTGRLPVVARGRRDKFTLMLMQGTCLSVKDQSEGYQHTSLNCESSVKSLDDLELNEPLITDELVGLCDSEDPVSERCTTNNLKEMWTQLDDLTPDGLEQEVLGDLLEDEFMTKLKKRQAAEQKLREEIAARKAPKTKKALKYTEKRHVPSQSGVGCVHSSVPRCFGRVAAGHPTMAKETGMYNSKGRKVSKMEADSQSQDEVIVIDDDDDEPPIKQEPEVKYEEPESSKWESNPLPAILRAVVRPENIEQLAPTDSLPEEVEDKHVHREIVVCTEQEKSEESGKKLDEHEVQGGEVMTESVKEVADVETTVTSTIATSSTETEQAPPLEEPKTTTDLLLEEITKVSSAGDGIPQLWMDVDGNLQNQPFEDLFDPNDPNYMFYPEVAGDTRNWSFSHDFILGQYDDDLFSQYECGNTNAFPDFYNDQQDMVFTGADILSPPLLDMMRDEPGEYQLTTHWEDLSMMVSESYAEKTTTESPEREESLVETENDGPKVVFIDKRKGRRGKSKKVKEPSPPSKDVEPVVEKKSKEKHVEGMFFFVFFMFIRALQGMQFPPEKICFIQIINKL